MIAGESSPPPLTVLILAASRQGVDDSVAKLQNKSHKCLVQIDGIAMIERVIQTLLDSKCFGRILISIESVHALHELSSTKNWLDDGIIEIVPSAGNLADSLINLTGTAGSLLPLVITTADNALHTPELIIDFVNAYNRTTGDVAVAVTRESTVLSEYPSEGIRFFQFRDGGYSFCNLYGVRSVKGLDAARIFRSGGQFRKRPWRILQEFGVLLLVLYKLRLASINDCLRRVAIKFGITIDTVILSYAYGSIDVDNPKSFAISEQTLRKRRERII